ncbi:hypothetical protein ETAA8_24460 [Anatilimnocola aggregata]|uniref:YopA central domain-containing protein n=1 Tax=Anatilimnocola aggregata TaxID=2528021 RepID=A0A517YAX2_9BACT|nr:hypothetical protein [Anatilimnocola aggregata]QDU27359.1 hypothetical protein ETAA8_24460 [Anatilimnocola aggregata]
MSLEILLQAPIAPVYTQNFANEPISFGNHSIDFEVDGVTLNYEADFRLRFAPRDRLEIVCPMNGDEGPAIHTLFDRGDLQLRFTKRNVSFDALFSSAHGSKGTLEFVPARSAICATAPSNCISRAVVHLFNLPKFLSAQDYIFRTHEPPLFGGCRCGRVVLRFDGWTITIAANLQTGKMLEELKEKGGYAITHICEIVREDSSQFSTKSVTEIITCLQYFLSFAFGRWSAVALPVGFDENGRVVHEEWGLPMVSDGAWNSSQSWFCEQEGEILSQVFPGFANLFFQKTWRKALTNALYWYLGASDRGVGIGVDTGLILAQTALEGLAWTYCVEDKKLVTKDAFAPRGLSAANRLRLLTTSLGIPSEIPKELRTLHAQPGKQWEDGLEAVTKIRNGLVHSGEIKGLPEGAFYDAWRLSMWYLDLVLLRLCGHEGNYANRITRRAVWESSRVPWKV